ncbi:hypothetical protein GCM10027299_28300 [Larkinella ripae]
MIEKYSSPNGTYQVVFDVFEVRMSHWVEVPRIIRVSDGAALFDLRGAVWSADRVQWLTDSEVELSVRKYPGRITGSLVLNFNTGTGKAVCNANPYEGPLHEVRSWVLAH